MNVSSWGVIVDKRGVRGSLLHGWEIGGHLARDRDSGSEHRSDRDRRPDPRRRSTLVT